jgi:hypothetical protein
MAGGMVVDMKALRSALDVIEELPPDSGIGSPMAPLVYLHTGRLGAESWAGEFVTGPGMKGLSLRTFYLVGGQPDMQRAYAAVRRALREYPQLGLDYVFSRRFPAEDFVLVALRDLPGTMPVFTSPEYQIVALPWSDR